MKLLKSKSLLVSAIIVALFSIGFLGIQVYASYNGNSVKLADKIAGEDLTNDVMKVETQNTGYVTSTSPGTQNAIKSGAGLLHSVTISSPKATGIVYIYDALTAAGTPIATITTTVTSTPFTLTYDKIFATGLSVKTEGQAQNISISYR